MNLFLLFMTKFICKDCNYRFESEEIKRCPYCNNLNIIKDLGAEDLIDKLF